MHWSIIYLGWVDAEDEFFSFSVTCKQESLLSGVFRQTNPSVPAKNIFYWKITLAVILIQLPPDRTCGPPCRTWILDGDFPGWPISDLATRKGTVWVVLTWSPPHQAEMRILPRKSYEGPEIRSKVCTVLKNVWALALCLVSPSSKTATFYKQGQVASGAEEKTLITFIQ